MIASCMFLLASAPPAIISSPKRNSIKNCDTEWRAESDSIGELHEDEGQPCFGWPSFFLVTAVWLDDQINELFRARKNRRLINRHCLCHTFLSMVIDRFAAKRNTGHTVLCPWQSRVRKYDWVTSCWNYLVPLDLTDPWHLAKLVIIARGQSRTDR